MTRRRMGAKFTMFPDAWDYQLAKIKADGCTYRVAIYLLRESWRVDNNRVKLPNGVLKERGVGRWGKQRALRVLGRAGLISIEQKPRKSPIVTVSYLLESWIYTPTRNPFRATNPTSQIQMPDLG